MPVLAVSPSQSDKNHLLSGVKRAIESIPVTLGCLLFALYLCSQWVPLTASELLQSVHEVVYSSS